MRSFVQGPNIRESACRPVSSASSLFAQSSTLSPNSRCPPAKAQLPIPRELFRLPNRTLPSLTTTIPTPTRGLFFSCSKVINSYIFSSSRRLEGGQDVDRKSSSLVLRHFR